MIRCSSASESWTRSSVFRLHMPSTIATFRAGCILQGYLLGPMTKAFEDNPDLSNLMCLRNGDPG